MSRRKRSAREARAPAGPETASAPSPSAVIDPRLDRVWLLALPVACWAALAAAAGLGRHFDYDLWDNFEYFTPILGFAHGLWLKGVVPLWNPHQHLGEPILAAGQPGVLYLPYTLSVFLTRALGLGPGRLMLTIVLLHTPIAAIGWYRLARRVEVRPVFAGIAALSASLGGFVTTVSTVWIFMQAAFAWLPWVLYGIVRQLDDPGWAGGVALVGGLVATALLGHPQMLVYQWLAAGLFLAAFGRLVYARPARVLGILALFAWAAVLSLPALLPMGELLALSIRTQAFGLDEFVIRSVDPPTFVGWLLPFFNATNGFLPDRASVMGYQGAWVVPAVVAGALSLRGSWRTLAGRAFCASAIVVVLLLSLALGGNSPLYRATYGLPIWSSLRWPFKLFLLSQGGLVLVAALGLELWTRWLPTARLIRVLPIALFVIAAGIAAAGVGVAPDRDRVALAGLLGAAATLAALPWLERRWAWVLFAAGAFASIVALTASAHDMSMKTYREPYGTIGARELGLRLDARVLPLTSQDPDAPLMQPLALLGSATANGYLSATGTTAGLVPTWYDQTLPCDVYGVPNPGVTQVLLPSHLLRSFNIGVVIVGIHDLGVRALVEGAGGFRLVKVTSDALVYEVPGTLPRAYFAGQTYPFEENRFTEGMVLNRAPVDAAFIGGWTGRETPARGRVSAARWGDSEIEVDVDAPQGGFLVISVSDFPGWSCRVDGRITPIHRVNGRIMGVELPRGARHVRLEMHSARLTLGLEIAGLGSLVALVGLGLGRRRRWLPAADASQPETPGA